MKNDSLIVMVAGMSSRMKKSISQTQVPKSVATIAMQHHKSLIPLPGKGKPILFYLLENAVNAGIKTIYLVTSADNHAFKAFVQQYCEEGALRSVVFRYAIQNVPVGRQKPLGTADALLQCLEQHPNLLKEKFTVCNGDNLYSARSLQLLRKDRSSPHALIAYDRSGLEFSDEKIAKFAVLSITKDVFLLGITEKPDMTTLESFRDADSRLRVSMNIFNFEGSAIYPYLKSCPVHPIRLEKELPEAVRTLIRNEPQGMLCIPLLEHVPDLTTAEDIDRF